MEDGRLFAMQVIQEVCQTYCLSVSSDVRTVQAMIKSTTAAFTTACGDEAFICGFKRVRRGRQNGVREVAHSV